MAINLDRSQSLSDAASYPTSELFTLGETSVERGRVILAVSE